MKPWEETWMAYGINIRRPEAPDLLEDIGDIFHDGRAKLAAAAPELVRVLLEVERSAGGSYDVPECPVCGFSADSDRRVWPTSHAENCTLDAALRKAGVR